jgi:hypothetical protein
LSESVRVDFLVGGIADVEKAFRSIDQTMARFERAQRSGGQRRVREARQEAGQMADAHVKATERWTKQRDKIIENSAKLAGRIAKQQTDAEKREAERRAKEEKRLADQKGRIQEGAARKAEQLARRQADVEKREADRTVKAREQAAKRSADAEKRLADYRHRVQLNSARAASAATMRQAKDEARASAKVDKTYGRFSGIATGTAGRLTSAAVGLGAAAMTLGGGLTVADTVSRSMSAERAAIALSNSAYIPGETSRPNKDYILSVAKGVQATTNIDKTDLIEGLQSYVAKSSDFAGGMAGLGNFAKLAKASGSKFGDVMNAAGMLRAQNKDLGQDEMMDMLRSVIGQGKMGAVELSDLAHIAGRVTSSASSYQGTQSENQRKLLGLSQIAMRTAGSSDDAATAVTRFASDIQSHRDKIADDFGADFSKSLVNEKGQVSDPEKVISAIFAKTGGDLGKMGEGVGNIGLGKESMKLMNALAPTFLEAEKRQKGSGAEAVRQEVHKFTSAGYSKEDVEKDFAAVMKASGEKFDHAINTIREALEEKLAPKIERFAEKLPDLIPKVEQLIDAFDMVASYLLENPLKGAAAIIGAEIAKDVIAAKVGDMLKDALTKTLSATSGAVVLPIATAAITIASIDAWFAGAQGKQKDDATLLNKANNAALDLQSKIATGSATPEDFEKNRELREKLQRQIGQGKKAIATHDTGDGIAGTAAGVAAAIVSPTEYKESRKSYFDALSKQVEEAEKALSRLTAAANKGAPALAEHSAASPTSPARNVSPSSAQRGGTGT